MARPARGYRALAPALVLVALSAVACGAAGDPDSGSPKQVEPTPVVAETRVESAEGSTPGINDKGCIAQTLLTTLGYYNLDPTDPFDDILCATVQASVEVDLCAASLVGDGTIPETIAPEVGTIIGCGLLAYCFGLTAQDIVNAIYTCTGKLISILQPPPPPPPLPDPPPDACDPGPDGLPIGPFDCCDDADSDHYCVGSPVTGNCIDALGEVRTCKSTGPSSQQHGYYACQCD